MDDTFEGSSPKASRPGCLKKIVFGQFNPIFSAGAKREIQLHDLGPLPQHVRIEYIFQKYSKIHKVIRSTRSRILFGDDYKMIYSILKVIKRDLSWSMVLMIFNLAIIYLIPFMTKLLIKEIKTRQEINTKVIILAIAIVITKALIGLLNENFRDHRNKFKAQSGQILRGIFFEKIKNCNYRFLYDADAGFISNMINQEID